MAPPAKTPSILADLRAFALNIAPTVPYADLAGLLREAGYTWYLRQHSAVGLADGSVLLTFDVLMGKDDIAASVVLDQVSSHLGPQPGPVSLAARMGLDQTLLFMIFGRLPPAPEIARAPERTVEMNGRDSEDFVLEDDAQQEYVDDSAPQAIEVVARREPDGLPIFVDLYEVEAAANDIVAAVLAEIGDFLDMAQTVEQVTAVAAKNAPALQFLRDLGEPADLAALKGLVDKRRGQLAAGVTPAAVPRRRAAGSRAN